MLKNLLQTLVIMVGRIEETGMDVEERGPCLSRDQVSCMFYKTSKSTNQPTKNHLVFDQHKKRLPDREAEFTFIFQIYEN